MNATAPHVVHWRERAACADADTRLFFTANSAAALAFCGRCPVRAECLYEGLTHEARDTRYGIWGGLTKGQRGGLPPLPGPKAAAIGLLRQLLERLDAADGGDHSSAERTDSPMSATTPSHTASAPAAEPELVTTSQLLRWAEEHPDPDVKDQGARAEATLTGLRTRYAADKELATITSEAAKLERRLAELRAREAELAPRPKKKRSGSYVRDYDTRTVRAWADENGVDCPRVGQIPKRVLDAWRQATNQPVGGSS